MDRRHRAAKGLKMVPSLCLLLAALAIGAIAQARADCFHTREAPEGPRLWSRVLSTDRGRVLADVAGYVRLFDPGLTGHVPLRFNQAVDLYQSARDGLHNHKLTLAGECVVLGLNYTRVGSQVVYHELEMHLNTDQNGGFSWRRRPCEFSPKFALQHSKDRHFACLDERSHPCFHEGKAVAELVLRRFKFETSVEPELFAAGTFDKAPLEESCAYW
jgi:hypothetical protein